MRVTDNRNISKYLDDFKKKLFDDIEKRCRRYCIELCRAAITHRYEAPRAHNFTGNLLNSIVVCLYREQKPVIAYYAADLEGNVKHVKMTAPRRYRFKQDYDGARSVYKAEVVTDEGWGEEDARKFFSSYRPSGNYLFTIVVAYTTEYAAFVENHRQSTGFLKTYAFAERTVEQYLKLPRVK